ncbi:MAG: ATP-binding cassette domain-containing protein [Eubacteriales bacterium]
MQPYQGHITIGGVELSEIEESNLMQTITYISHNSYLFKGTVRDNLLMGDPNATDEQMWHVLEQTKLAAFLRSEQGLDTLLLEKASNLSGGQCQRLALSRALLHNSPIYIFDEATSNIDVESEDDIMEQIYHLAKTKTVILISHRLANVVQADHIYVMKHGSITEQGTHERLMEQQGTYYELYHSQKQLEQYRKEAAVCNREANRTVMMRLIGLVKPLTGYMILAVLLGVVGFLCAIFITIFGGWALLDALHMESPVPMAAAFAIAISIAVARGFLRYGEQACNHYIALEIIGFDSRPCV